MHSHQYVFVHWFPRNNRYVLSGCLGVVVATDLESPVSAWHLGLSFESDSTYRVIARDWFRYFAVVKDLSNADNRKAFPCPNFLKLRKTHHGAICRNHLGYNSNWGKASKLQKINCCFSVSRSSKHTIRVSTQRNNVTWTNQMRWLRVDICKNS